MLKDIFYSLGQRDALDLRARANKMDGTAIIREEAKVPSFDPTKDYSGWPVGAPVQDGGQVWVLIQPYNAANYQGRPADLRALWSLCHTKDAKRAKAWVDPAGTSGLYTRGECYKDEGGQVWRCEAEQTNYDAEALPSAWAAV